MNNQKIKMIADKIQKIAKIQKTAGEVRFIKDRATDGTSWAYSNESVPKRNIPLKNSYNVKNKEPLNIVLNHSMTALDSVSAAYDIFAKLKSVDISPDGMLGGKGYIAKIVDMRKQFMNIIEALSSISDTIHDEIQAQHWQDESRQRPTEEKKSFTFE